MGSADFSRQALLRDGKCCIVFAASVRSPRVPTRSFTLIPVPSTVGVPCSYWTLACSAASPTLHSLFGIPVRQASALPRASFRPTPHGGALASGCILPTAGRIRDFHPLERAPAGRTKERLAQKPGQPFPSKTKHSERFLKCTGFFIPVRQATHRAGSGSTPPLCRCQPPQACCSSHRGSSPSRRCCRKRAAFCTAQ